MRQVTGSMTNVVRGMDQAMKAMDLEKVHRPLPTPSLFIIGADWSCVRSPQ
jgi:hypothetical protein